MPTYAAGLQSSPDTEHDQGDQQFNQGETTLQVCACHVGFLGAGRSAAIGQRFAEPWATGQVDDHDLGVVRTAIVTNSE